MDNSRNTEVDVLRSAALFGICVVNLPFLGLPAEAQLAPAIQPLDRIAAFGVEWLFQGKFFLLFSFIFGWGFGVQIISANRQGKNYVPAYLRRLAGLALFGVLHALLVFSGDILLLYALLGLLLLPLAHLSPRALIRLAVAILPVAALCLFGLGLILGLEGAGATGQSGLAGTFAEATRQRLADWPDVFFFVALFSGPLALGAFVLGLAAARTSFLTPGHPGWARLTRAVPWLIAPAFALNAIYAAAMGGLLPPPPSPLPILSLTALALGAPLLAALWLWLLVEMARRMNIPAALHVAGRNSLTAYVTQGILAGLAFGAYGLGLFGQLGASGLFVLSCAVWAATTALAAFWQKIHQRGPLEILLRLITRGTAN